MSIKLGTLSNGALEERFARELKTVLENIADPNTDAKKNRSISIKINIKPSESREAGTLDFEVKSSLASASKVGTFIVMDEEEAAEIGKNAPGQRFIDTETGEIQDTPQVQGGKLLVIGK